MSENTPDTPFTAPNVPPSQPRPVTPPPYPPAGYRMPPHNYPSPPPQRPSGCGKAVVIGLISFFVLGLIGVFALIGSVVLFTVVATDAFNEIAGEQQKKTVIEKFIGGNSKADKKIVIITIDGIIAGDADGFVAKQIRKVMSDDSVKAVVLRVDSPGGTMTGSDYYLYLLKKMKKECNIPVIVSMGSIAASGGYYVSMVGDEIYAEPSTITGSIGVIASLFDASELFKMIGVKANPIVSGEHKAMGSITKPMSDEERAIWQNLIDDNFDRFKEIIREGRREFARNPADLDKLATGQVYTANEAVANKLIDNIGYLDDAIERACQKASLDEREYKVIQYKPKLSVMDALLESRSPNKLLSGKTLSEVTTPKVYLLSPYVIPVEGVE